MRGIGAEVERDAVTVDQRGRPFGGLPERRPDGLCRGDSGRGEKGAGIQAAPDTGQVAVALRHEEVLETAQSQSQLSAPPVLYSVTRVSKKFFSFLRSIISLIHGNGLVAPGNIWSRPIC